MLARQDVFPAGQCGKELVVEKPTRKLEMTALSGRSPGLKLIFREGVAFIPGMLAEILARLCMFVARNGPWRQERHGGLGRVRQRRGRRIVMAEPLRVQQSADEFVVGVSRETVVAVKLALGVDGRCIGAHQALHLGTRRGILRDCVVTRQCAHPLPEGRAGGKGISVIPAAEVVTGRALPGAYAERAQQCVLVQPQQQTVILARLAVNRAGGKLYLPIGELQERCGGGTRQA